MKKNRYRRALTHLKSTKIDEKIQRLNEGPTNSISGVYALNPPGFRLGDPDPERIFYADVDGNWPAGIPGEEGELTYTRPKGFWDKGPGTSPATQTIETRDFTTVSGENGTNTDNLIRSSDGFVLADLPPNTRNFILGPLVDGYVLNHGVSNITPQGSDYTNIGYIQKDTRQFVLLGRIQGTWSSKQAVEVDIGFGLYKSRIWDGSASGFTSYNANFTLEHALWFRQKMLSGKFTPAVPYKYSGAVPQPENPDNPGFKDGNIPDDGKAGGPSDDQGSQQVPPNHGGPDPNLVPGSANPNIAQLSDKQERKELQMLLKGLIRGDYGTGPNIDQQIRNIEIKLYGIPIKGADAGADGDIQIAGGPTLYGPNGPSLKPDGTSGFPKPGELNKGNNGQWYEYVPGSGWIGIPSLKLAHYQAQGQVLTESRQRILREIKKPVKVSEPPKQKLEKYRPNFAGKYTPQNTPDVTASPKSDEMVKVKNSAGQTWRTADKHWSRYESTERMNIIYDNVGHGSQYWDKIVNENQLKKVLRDREVQEQLNIIAHEKAMLREDPLYESPFRKAIQEQETLQADKDPLFKRVANKIKPAIDYPDKPSKLGYPDMPPPETVNGWNPEYGQKGPYYNKLDPQSANAMPPTGNPEIDAKVRRAKTLKKALGKKA